MWQGGPSSLLESGPSRMLPGIEIPVASLKTSPIALPFGGRSHSLSSLRGTQRFECVCCLAATAPAPSSRGPPLPVSARSRKSLQIVTPITGAVSGAGPRFECLQTKRCAYLWFARYPCSIFHPLGSRLSILICHNSVVTCPRWSSSSSAPAFRHAGSLA